MTRFFALLVSLLLAAPAGAQTWTAPVVQPRQVDQSYLGGSQSIAQGQPGQAVSVCPRPVVVDGTIYRSFSGAIAGGGKYYNFGGGHAGHPANDLDVFDIAARTWLPQPYPAECPPPYNPDGTPNSIWRQIKGGATGTQGFSPTGKPYVHHTYRLTAWDTTRNRLLFMSGNGLMAWSPATNAWTLLAGRNKAAGEVAFAGYGGVIFDAQTDSVFLIAGDTVNAAARGVYQYTLNPDGTVATKAYLHPWPTLAGWTFAGKLVTAVHGPGRTIYFTMTPASSSTSVPPNRLFTYDLTTRAVVWDQTLVPGQPAYDALGTQGKPFRRWDRRAATGELYFWTGPVGANPAGVWIKSEATNAWRFQAVPNGPDSITDWTLAYDATTDTFVGLDFRNNYCGLTGVACGGIADTWVLSFGAAPPPPPPPPTTYPLTLSGAGTGSGSFSGQGSYLAGAPVTLTAVPNATSTFTSWGAAPCADQFLMPAAPLACAITFTATAPPPPPPPSGFAIGARVRVATTGNLSVRDAPGLSSTILGTHTSGAEATIVGGTGAIIDNISWWQLDYDAGFDGWSGATYLEVITAAPPPVVVVPPPGSGDKLDFTIKGVKYRLEPTP